MKTRIVLQDNLWFRAAPRFSNYRLKGRTMIPVRYVECVNGFAIALAAMFRFISLRSTPTIG